MFETVVLNFGNLNLEFVSSLGFRYSNLKDLYSHNFLFAPNSLFLLQIYQF